MKVKRSLYLIAGFLCMVLLPLSCSVAGAHAGVQIKSVSMQLKETRPPVGNKEIHIYDITVLVYNNDTSASDNISVFFRDPEPGMNTSMQLLPLYSTIGSMETKTFTFTAWPTTLSGKISVNFSIRPSSHGTLPTEKNTVDYLYSLTIPTTQKTTSTPGFELLIVLGALAVFLLWRKIRT